MKTEEMTIDPQSQNAIRATDNSPKEEDSFWKGEQIQRPLTEEEIQEKILDLTKES